MNATQTITIREARNVKGLELCVQRLTEMFAAAERGQLNVRCPLVPVFSKGIFQAAEVEEQKKDRIELHEQKTPEPVRRLGRR